MAHCKWSGKKVFSVAMEKCANFRFAFLVAVSVFVYAVYTK